MPSPSRVRRSLDAILAGSLFATASLAGPPYATDDPVPTDHGHWEIYPSSPLGQDMYNTGLLP